jgi:two-component system CheB/CheR fusion protein
MKKRTNKKNPPASTEEGQPTSNLFPIVGIGASAGGLKAFELFFKAVPENSGLAFVLIQHLAPDHESELAQLLQNHTHMNVLQVEAEPSIEPNHVYVIPPGKSLVIKNRVLYLSEPQEARGHRSPIDLFFRSLAEDQGENAVGIVLSGTGADGTTGLKAIKEVGGVTMVQSPAEAEYDGMPRNAIQTGLIDVIGPVAELAEKLVTYQHTLARIHVPAEEHRLPRNDSEALDSIFIRLRTQTGHDFTNYKRSTILRRIARRLHVNQIESISAYVNFLDQNPEENQALFKNFLISVTNFFRDPDAFYVLEEKIVPELFKNKGQDDQVRVWVAGCATGEEAYSLAILLIEYATQLPEPPDIQIFATDIDSDAIAFAREGCYPSSITVDVSPARLQRFFSEEAGSYRVKKELRECILFAVHNLIKDPPFSRMDLISCRNLLIYLNRDVQDKVYALFTYALKPGGYLFLGSSESADTGSSLFTTYDKSKPAMPPQAVQLDTGRK